MRLPALVFACAGSAAGQFTDPSVRVLWTADAESNSSQYAWQCEAIGDISGGDGVSEIVVTAPFSRVDGIANHGTAFVYDGATGSMLHRHAGEILNGCLGFRTFAAPDLSGDGIPEYIITQAGAQGNTVPDQAGAAFRGYINVYSGADHSLHLRIEGPTPEGRLGVAASVIDDLTGDGIAEILGGAPQAATAGIRAGAAYVFDGSTGEILRIHTGSGDNALFGNGVTVAPDVTGDGIREYAIGAYGEGDARRGRVRLFDGATGDVLYVIDPNKLPGGETAVDFSRFFMSVAGDADGDGVDELYIGDWYDAANGPITGRVWVIDPSPPAAGLQPRVVQTITGSAAGEWLGFGRGFPDVNGDGNAELLVCSYGLNGFRGGVGLYSGATGEQIRFIERESLAIEQFGYDACSPGDVDGDGIDDIVVTEAGDLSPGDRGRVWAIAGIRHTCPADTNSDGAVMPDDFNAWVIAFNSGAPACDQNSDGSCDPSDFNAWIVNFNQGC